MMRLVITVYAIVVAVFAMSFVVMVRATQPPPQPNYTAEWNAYQKDDPIRLVDPDDDTRGRRCAGPGQPARSH
jgi:hypothetical protein